MARKIEKQDERYRSSLFHISWKKLFGTNSELKRQSGIITPNSGEAWHTVNKTFKVEAHQYNKVINGKLVFFKPKMKKKTMKNNIFIREYHTPYIDGKGNLRGFHDNKAFYVPIPFGSFLKAFSAEKMEKEENLTSRHIIGYVREEHCLRISLDYINQFVEAGSLISWVLKREDSKKIIKTMFNKISNILNNDSLLLFNQTFGTLYTLPDNEEVIEQEELIMTEPEIVEVQVHNEEKEYDIIDNYNNACDIVDRALTIREEVEIVTIEKLKKMPLGEGIKFLNRLEPTRKERLKHLLIE